jgi:chaperone modulatory protein CbpM
MRIEAEVLWFEQHVLSLPELAEISGLPGPVLEELLDCGAIAPIESSGTEPGAVPGTLPGTDLRFGAAALRAARTARRLRADFELDVQALAVALGLLDRVAELEAQLRELRARQPQRMR